MLFLFPFLLLSPFSTATKPGSTSAALLPSRSLQGTGISGSSCNDQVQTISENEAIKPVKAAYDADYESILANPPIVWDSDANPPGILIDFSPASENNQEYLETCAQEGHQAILANITLVCLAGDVGLDFHHVIKGLSFCFGTNCDAETVLGPVGEAVS